MSPWGGKRLSGEFVVMALLLKKKKSVSNSAEMLLKSMVLVTVQKSVVVHSCPLFLSLWNRLALKVEWKSLHACSIPCFFSFPLPLGPTPPLLHWLNLFYSVCVTWSSFVLLDIWLEPQIQNLHCSYWNTACINIRLKSKFKMTKKKSKHLLFKVNTFHLPSVCLCLYYHLYCPVITIYIATETALHKVSHYCFTPKCVQFHSIA